MNQRPPPGAPVFDPELGFEVVTVPSKHCHVERDGENTLCVYTEMDCLHRDCRTPSSIIYPKKETYLALKILGTL